MVSSEKGIVELFPTLVKGDTSIYKYDMSLYPIGYSFGLDA